MAMSQQRQDLKPSFNSLHKLDPQQTVQASKVLLSHIRSKQQRDTAKVSQRSNLLSEDVDSADEGGSTSQSDSPIWMILTTKKHIVDRKRLKPCKVVIPHPLQNKTNSSICLITPDPQRLYKDTIAHPSFPNPQIRDKISRVIGLSKLKANYKSFESRRQLFAEHDIFLADSRVIVSLPSVLGKVFFKGGSKRPIPIDIAGPRARGEDGKRLKAAPQSVRKAPPDAIGQGAASPATVAKEIESCLSAALVHLSPGVSTAVKVARGDFSPEMCFQNMEAVLRLMTERLIPKGWNNIRAIHIKGPTTASFPIWLASQLWVDDEDILEEKKIQGKNRNQDSSQRSRDDNAVPSDASGKRKARSRDITDVSQPRSKKKKSEAEMKPAQEQAGRKRFLKNQKSEAMSGLSGALTQD